MAHINNFGVIGGDKRQISMAESISFDGYNVYVSGFENARFKSSIVNRELSDVVKKSECIILPLPVTKDNITLNAPFSDAEIILNEEFAERMKGKKVFCGIASKLYQTSDVWENIEVYDYYAREEYAVKNAVPTAEGAIEIAMRESPGTINGSKCLVSGFGRIGKVLASMLKGLGADVIVSARKQSDLAWIEVLGYTAIKTENIKKTRGLDIIFNTIPYMIYDFHTLAFLYNDAIIIDLASDPGGVDVEAVKRLGIKYIQALSLPGKVAPKAAGEITKQTIYNMLKEDGG